MLGSHAQVYEMGDFWRVDYEDKIRILRDCGVIPTEEQYEIASV